MPRLAVGREVALEVLHPLAEDEVLRVVDLRGDAEDLLADGGVLQFQVEQRDRHGGGSLDAFRPACVSTLPSPLSTFITHYRHMLPRHIFLPPRITAQQQRY